MLDPESTSRDDGIRSNGGSLLRFRNTVLGAIILIQFVIIYALVDTSALQSLQHEILMTVSDIHSLYFTNGL